MCLKLGVGDIGNFDINYDQKKYCDNLSTNHMFHNWSHPQTFCRHQTVPVPTTSSDYYNTICRSTCRSTYTCTVYVKLTFLAYCSIYTCRIDKKSFVSIDSHDHNNTHQLTNIGSAINEIDVYHSFLT